LWPLITLRYLKFDAFAFIQCLKSVALNRTIVNEDIAAAFFFNKAITFCVIEPFDLTSCHLPTSLHAPLIFASAWSCARPGRRE